MAPVEGRNVRNKYFAILAVHYDINLIQACFSAAISLKYFSISDLAIGFYYTLYIRKDVTSLGWRVDIYDLKPECTAFQLGL